MFVLGSYCRQDDFVNLVGKPNEKEIYAFSDEDSAVAFAVKNGMLGHWEPIEIKTLTFKEN